MSKTNTETTPTSINRFNRGYVKQSYQTHTELS
jgi:hypothetical protein